MYEQFFGLSENPFSLTPDPRFIFPSRSHDEALAHLRYWLEHREGFALITGEVGTGKTTALFRMIDGLPREYEIAFITNSTLAPVELLEDICRKFGSDVEPGQSKPALLQKIEAFVRRQAERGNGSLLIIDEAQNFDHPLLEEVRLLSNIARPSGPPLLQIALVGQPELERKLGKPELRQLKQRIGVQYKIEPLNEDETLRYVHHRISVAGGFPRVLFPPETVSVLHRQTHGLPREINQLASQAMLGAYVEDSTSVRPEHVLGAVQEMGFQSVLDRDGLVVGTTMTPSAAPGTSRAAAPLAEPGPLASTPASRPVVVDIKPFQPAPTAPPAEPPVVESRPVAPVADTRPAPPAPPAAESKPAPPPPPPAPVAPRAEAPAPAPKASKASGRAGAPASTDKPRARVRDFGALPPIVPHKSPVEQNAGRRRWARIGIWGGIVAILGVAGFLLFLPQKPKNDELNARQDEQTLPVVPMREPMTTGESAPSQPLASAANPPAPPVQNPADGAPATASGTLSTDATTGGATQAQRPAGTPVTTQNAPTDKAATTSPAPAVTPPAGDDAAALKPRQAFHLQVASFAESLTAVREGMKASQATGLPWEIVRDRKADHTWWGLYLGTFATRDEALAARAAKGSLYPNLDSALVREPRRR